ncbi:unnamed protein product [Rotaria socialis]|uniref:DYW domain-containing protein n=2 Tax=Rotaria socialis TaxID=392032 RepID=A0A817P3V5_9BILA|nr:unnamed protein product [Rotaria socialis]
MMNVVISTLQNTRVTFSIAHGNIENELLLQIPLKQAFASELHHNNLKIYADSFEWVEDAPVNDYAEEIDIYELDYVEDERLVQLAAIHCWHHLRKINLKGDYPDDNSVVGDNISHLLHTAQRSPYFSELYIESDLDYGRALSLNKQLESLLCRQLVILHFTTKEANNSLGDLVRIIDKCDVVRSRDANNAYCLFSTITNKSNYIYATMLKGLISNNMPTKVLDLLDEMNIEPNQAILAVLFSACSRVANDRAMKIGRKLLDEMPKNFVNGNYIQNSAINILIRFGDVRSARNLFHMIRKKNIITYGTTMNEYNINSEPLKSLKLFEEMKRNDINADAIVLIILIGACARLGMLSKCQSIVAQIPLHFYENQRIRNSLIDMWGKADSVKDAQKIFESIDKPDVITYTAMINSFGLNRMGSEAVDLYRKMPNNLHDEVSTICVLNTCSHSGLLNEAHSIFNEVSHRTEKNYYCNGFRLFLFDEAQKLLEDYEKSNPPYSAMYSDHEEAENIRLNRIKEQFKAHDRSHSRSKEIYAEAERISSELIKHGHNYDSSWITRPLHENEKMESILCAHSERLAIAFNFIQETKPSFIQITKKSSCLR